MISRKIYEMFSTQSHVTEHLENTNAFDITDNSVQTTTPTVAQLDEKISIKQLVNILIDNATTYQQKYVNLTPYNNKNKIISDSKWTSYNNEDGWKGVHLFFTRKIIAELEIMYMMMQWDINKKITQANLSTLDVLKDLGLRVDDVTYDTRLAMFAANRVEASQKFLNVEDSDGYSPNKIESYLLSIYTYIYNNSMSFDNYLIAKPDSLSEFPQHVSDIMSRVSTFVYMDKPHSLFLINSTYRDKPGMPDMPDPTKNNDIFKLPAQTWDSIYYDLTRTQNKIKDSEQPNVSIVPTTTVPTTTVATTTVATTTAPNVAAIKSVELPYLPLTKKIIIIDSRYRNNYHTTLSNNCTFTLERETGLKKIIEMKLDAVHIKNNSYNININNNLLRMNIQVQDVKRPTDHIQNIIIPKGNYYQNKNDTETNLDLHIKHLFNLYEEFKNVSVYFNYKNNKYYFYQTYSYLLTEQSHMYNILFNFGTTDYIVERGQPDKQVREEGENEKDNKLFTNEITTNRGADSGFTNIEKDGRRAIFDPITKKKRFANFSIGQYLGFYPKNYSTHIINNVSVNYFQYNDIQDRSENNYNILQFNITNSETLFQKIYDLLVLAKRDMFIGFVLNSKLDNNNCKHAILKLEPGFCSNIVTHRSTSNYDDIFGTPVDPSAETVYTIELYIKTKLHQFPKFNIIIEPQNLGLSSSNPSNPTPFSDIIILPVISDKPYELNNDNYMLMRLETGTDGPIYNLESTLNAPKSVLESFAQFRTEADNGYFINAAGTSSKIFPAGRNFTTLKVELYDKNGNFIDLNNTDYSFILECMCVAPQLGALSKHLLKN